MGNSQPLGYRLDGDPPIDEATPSLDEVKEVAMLKSRKAPTTGIYDISMELLNTEDPVLILGLHPVRTAIWQSCTISPYWKIWLVIPIWKRKEDHQDWNYCGAMLFIVPDKVPVHLLLMQICSLLPTLQRPVQYSHLPSQQLTIS